MNNYGYYTCIKKPCISFRVDYPLRRQSIWFAGPFEMNIIVHHQLPSLTFEISNERLARIMDHA